MNDGGNGIGIYFNPGNVNRTVYTTGIVAPVVYALGEALGPDTEVGMGGVTDTMTYSEVMRDVIDYYSYGQVDGGSGRGGWRYYANYGNSDNSTAQWGSLPSLYGEHWGLETPQWVKDELALWADYVQNNNGGSGYSYYGDYVNVSKTGGMLVQFSELGYTIGTDNDVDHLGQTGVVNEVDAALAFINSRWNNGPSGTWYGNINHPYAMWAVYKGLAEYGFTDVITVDPDGIPGSGDEYEQLIGYGMSNAPGGITIGQDWATITSDPGDWYSHYCDWLVNNQNDTGSWNGYSYWTGALATGWYINILNATGTAEPVIPDPIPAPGAFLLGSLGLAFSGWKLRRRKEA